MGKLLGKRLHVPRSAAKTVDKRPKTRLDGEETLPLTSRPEASEVPFRCVLFLTGWCWGRFVLAMIEP